MNRPEVESELKMIRYGLYKVACRAESGEFVQRYFIVLRDQYGLIVHWTRLGRFVGLHRELLRPISRDNAKQFSFVVQMLNYFLCDDRADHHVDSIADVTKPMLFEYFAAYAHTKSQITENYRSEDTVQENIYACTAFLSNLQKRWPEMNLTQNDLWKEKTVIKNASHRARASKREVVQVPDFEVSVFAKKQDAIFRDIPNFVLERMFQLACQYLPQLVMPMALGAFAGLRPGECCQVQQEKAGGIQLREAGGVITSIMIDLSMDQQLRSDGVPTGTIKKYRKQPVYPGFQQQFLQALWFQKQYLAERGFESEFAPLVIDSRGMAMTVKNYRRVFQKLVTQYLRPALLADPDPRSQQYGQMLMTQTLGPHAMRHCYSVNLVLAGENATQLQYYRGDSDPNSSYVYLTNKTELMERYQQVSEVLLSELLRKGAEDAERIAAAD